LVPLAGICRTDLEIARGYLGFRGTPGHEWVGDVLAADDPALVGRRVVGEINLACGVCPACRAGLGRHCPTRRVLGIAGADGGFAELIAVPAANLHPVPDTVTDREAVFAEPLAAAFEILDQMPGLAGARTVVLKTTVAAEHRLDLAPAVINEVTILGSRCGRFPPALAALAARRVSVAPLIDAVYPLDDAVAAFARAATPGTLKVLVDAKA